MLVRLAEQLEQKDLLTWLIEASQDDERSIEMLSRRILAVNFAAIHTSSMVRSYVSWRRLLLNRGHRHSPTLFIVWQHILSSPKL